ncbi:hypothetical protein Pla175_07130 [Pirellulimonas nuda]|uniref:DUF2569 domain-containing protein n=1 Tax=Pirellulimonas nuda TaxID=2528009 RepID=A0A518D793_9BACT|nr:DUF2569 domain-containing protein [Pirellulimonas nuda]QDU87354.1 hypothetical protein Pla175_07130 [Pirellulimonas nuda]
MNETNPYQSPESVEEVTSPLRDEEVPSGIGGWLILPTIGVVLSPISLLVDTAHMFRLFTDGTWEACTTPGSEDYLPFWGSLLIFEMVDNLVFAAAFTFLAVLLFRKSRYFPMAYIGIALASLGLILLDAWLVSLVVPNQRMFDHQELGGALVGAAIWVPYMLISNRVKNTFV